MLLFKYMTQQYLKSRFGVQNTIISDNTNLHAVQLSEASHDGGRVQLLELMESAAITDASNHLHK